MTINQHPDYHEGFFDAIDFEPLHVDASPEYKAGWRAWWAINGVVLDDNFLDTPAAGNLPAEMVKP